MSETAKTENTPSPSNATMLARIEAMEKLNADLEQMLERANKTPVLDVEKRMAALEARIAGHGAQERLAVGKSAEVAELDRLIAEKTKELAELTAPNAYPQYVRDHGDRAIMELDRRQKAAKSDLKYLRDERETLSPTPKPVASSLSPATRKALDAADKAVEATGRDVRSRPGDAIALKRLADAVLAKNALHRKVYKAGVAR